MRELIAGPETGEPMEQAAPPEAGGEEMAAMDEDGEAASPEEQAQYDQITVKALSFINSEEGLTAVLQKMSAPGQEPFEALAQTAVMIVETIEKQAQAAKVDLSPDAVFHAAADAIIPELLEIGQAGGVLPEMSEQDEQDLMGMALYEGLRIKGEETLAGPDGGAVSQQAGDFLAQQVAAEADRGELDPDFARHAQATSPQMAKAIV